MELKLTRETIPTTETVFDGVQEQSLELDYILPDYCPDIFRLIRCDIEPVITDSSLNGSRLSYEVRCNIRILYGGGDGSAIRSVEQHRSYVGTVELGTDISSPEISLTPRTERVDLRAVNKRRIDLRGAVSVKILVTRQREQEVISDASGMNIQLKRTPVRYAAARLTAEKNFSIEESIDLGAARSDISDIISCRCRAAECESRLISGKLLVKGEAEVRLLCTGGDAPAPISFSLSYSQMLDMDGLDDSYSSAVTAEVISCEVTVSDSRTLRCEAELRLRCRAVKAASAMIAEDAFSTLYPCTVETAEIQTGQIPAVYDESLKHTAVIARGEEVPQDIFAMWSTAKNINARTGEDGRSVTISGMLVCSMAARDKSGSIIMPDRDEAFEETIVLPDDISGATISAEVSVRDTSYDISAANVLTARTDMAVRLSVYSSASVRAVTDISADTSVKKERDGDYAIKLYFGAENEDIWDIAKRYSTSVEAVMEENELSGERLESGGMLLIPIIS